MGEIEFQENMNYWTIHEMAEHLRVSDDTIARLLSDGEIDYVKVRRQIRIPKDQLKRLLVKKPATK